MTLQSFEERVKRGDYASPNLAELAITDRVFDINKVLICNGEGEPKALLANVITMLRCHVDWQGCLAFNEFSKFVTTKKPAPWHGSAAGKNWTDRDDSLATDWMQHHKILVNSTKVVAEAVQTVARENSFHPVRDYLRGLKWDKKPRITRWLSIYLGAEENTWTKAIGPRWLISAVARIEHPGCQVDYTLLLEGPQGIRKSTALRTLAGDEWFADHISDLGSKDSRIELHGKWIFEMAELAHIRGKEIQTVKAFLTASTDHFRLPYSRRAEDVPRSCVFAASVNDDTPLTDETGNRRFWPVKCGVIDVEALAHDRDQIWAEAHQSYVSRSPWWLDSAELNELASDEQEGRYECGVWDQEILRWCNDPKQSYKTDGGAQLPVEPFDSTRAAVTVTDILLHAIGKPLERHVPSDQNQVLRCLKHNGWKRKRDWTRTDPKKRGQVFYLRGDSE